jgi:hypothetical protein
LARAINKNQLRVLSALENNSIHTITSLLNKLSRKENTPISTLKLNAKILRDFGMIDFGNGSAAEITDFGSFVLEILGGDPK